MPRLALAALLVALVLTDASAEPPTGFAEFPWGTTPRVLRDELLAKRCGATSEGRRDWYTLQCNDYRVEGLVVPVLRNAERLSFAEIEKAIGDFGARAKEGKLKVEELQGGTFTISNGGVYGSLLSTPIVNPPQSGILGLHAIQDRPVAREGQVVIRPMMYVALTYDHRLIDGREAVTFLKRIKECVESPLRMLVES